MLDPRTLRAPNTAWDLNRVIGLSALMETRGWSERPLLAVDTGQPNIRCVTGAHRLAAAVRAKCPLIPVYVVHVGVEYSLVPTFGSDAWWPTFFATLGDSMAVALLAMEPKGKDPF